MAKVEVIAKNRKASFEYEFLDTYNAGMQLTGSEIKSIRDKQVSMSDSYCLFIGNELFLRSLHISTYNNASYNNHEPKRDRKLLLQKRELEKLKDKLRDKGLTIIPVKLFINEKGFAKIMIALAKGKKLYDKRDSIKSQDTKRQLDRIMKERG